MRCKLQCSISNRGRINNNYDDFSFKHIEYNQCMKRGELYYGYGTSKGINIKSIKYRCPIRHNISKYCISFHESIFHKGINTLK